MTSIKVECGQCKKSLPKNLQVISCNVCKSFYHVKCCGITQKNYASLKSENIQWHCKKCEYARIELDCLSNNHKSQIPIKKQAIA